MTADTFSNTLGFLIMGAGNDLNAWGPLANTQVFQVLEDAISNTLTSAVTGGTLDLSTPNPPAGISSARYALLKFTGVLASNQIVQVPNKNKIWLVKNATSGAFSLTFAVPAGAASDPVPQSSTWHIVIGAGDGTFQIVPLIGRSTTGARPSAATAPPGTPWFDTTLGIPIWSNGTSWVNASGSAV